jgi:hypothetical protein
MFKTTLSETHRSEDISAAWESAAHDAWNAWETWRASAPGDRGDAYVRYRASVDREEHAAEMLAAVVTKTARQPAVA